jgi:hypothetical protein
MLGNHTKHISLSIKEAMFISSRSAIQIIVAAIVSMILLSACGGGGGGGATPATNHAVTLSWSPNHEKGVNSPGGGYKVTISGRPAPIDVPYISASGVTPSSTMVTLSTGSYTATVSAYAALDVNGGATGSASATSSSISIVVP